MFVSLNCVFFVVVSDEYIQYVDVIVQGGDSVCSDCMLSVVVAAGQWTEEEEGRNHLK